MPTCAEFAFIDTYLSLRDQMDSEEPQIFYDLDQKVPQFMGEGRLPQLELDPPAAFIKTEPPMNFLDLEHCNPNFSHYATPTPTPTPVTTSAAAPVTSSSTPFNHSYTYAGCKSFVAEAAGSGCTLIEQPQSDQQVVNGNSPPPEFFDIDSQSRTFYDDAGSLKTIKEEPYGTMESWLIQQIRSEIEDDCRKLVCSNDCKLRQENGDVSYSNPQCPAPSISPAPSIGSTCSTMSSSSSGGTYHSDTTEDDVFNYKTFNKPTVTAQHRPAPTTPRQHPGPRQPKQTIHLWQFLRELLDDPESYHCCIRWTDRTRGVFKIEDSSKVAKLWGRRKNRPAMNYDKLSRSVRQYYKKGIIKKTEQSKRLVYQFCQPYL